MEEEPVRGPPSPGPAALPLLPPPSKNCPGFPPDRAYTAAAQGRSPFPTTGAWVWRRKTLLFRGGAASCAARSDPATAPRPDPATPGLLSASRVGPGGGGGSRVGLPPSRPPRVAGLKPGEPAFPEMPAGGEGPRGRGGSWDKGCRAPGGPKYWLRIDVSFRRGSSWYPHIPSVSLPSLFPVALGIGTCAPCCSKV